MLTEIISTIGGGVLGFAARLVPEVLKLFTLRRDQDHEYRMAQLQGEQARAGYDARIADGQMALQHLDLEALITATQAQATRTGIAIIDALSASVRPAVTYWWMALYTAVKVATVATAWRAARDPMAALLACWDGWDQTVLASIISYWFLDRSLRRAKGG